MKGPEAIERLPGGATRSTLSMVVDQSTSHRTAEIVRGRDAAVRIFAQLVGGATKELVVIDGGVHNGHVPRQLLRAAIAQHVYVRSVYARGSLLAGVPGSAPAIEPLPGEHARVLSAVPVTYVVVDGLAAATPLVVDDGGRINSVLVVWPCALLDTAIALAEGLWRQAVAIGSDMGGSEAVLPSPEDAILLDLLRQGLKDRAIARTLGIGERTVQRRLSTLMSELGAKTRFQAALNAVHRGWL